MDEGERVNFHVEFIPVISVEMPEFVSPGSTYPIKLYYTRPNDCYVLDGFYYEIDKTDDNARIVAIQSYVFDESNCTPITVQQPEVVTLNFECPVNYSTQSYTFKFYKGMDAAGNQEFLELQVPVVQ